MEQIVENLRYYGVSVEVFEQDNDAPSAVCLDWLMTAKNKFFPQGVLILGAMKEEERRRERS